VTVELMKHVCPGSYGLFRVVNRAALKSANCSDFKSFAATMTKQFPLVSEGSPNRRLREGFVSLNDPEQAEVCLATFQVFNGHLALSSYLK
jgi:hypothetical protein